MEDLRGCLPRRLVDRPPFRVDACGCGTLHLTAGILTVRLKRDAAHELAAALVEALAEEGAPDARALC